MLYMELMNEAEVNNFTSPNHLVATPACKVNSKHRKAYSSVAKKPVKVLYNFLINGGLWLITADFIVTNKFNCHLLWLLWLPHKRSLI